MPCTYYLPGEELNEIQTELNKIINLLCYCCQQIEKNNKKIILSNKELSIWWEKHKKFDEERIKQFKTYEEEKEKQERIIFEKLKKKYG